MVTALILFAVALIICLAFMGITTWMYFNLERDFQKQKLSMQSFATQFELFCADITEQHQKAKELNEATEDLVSKAAISVKNANDASDFAMKTIQEMRKMLRTGEIGQQVIFAGGKPVEIRSAATVTATEEKKEEEVTNE